MSTTQIHIVLQGVLKKKSPRGVFKHAWQSRWFVLTPECLFFYKKAKKPGKDEEAHGIIPLFMVHECRLVPKKKGRFNIVAGEGDEARLFCLYAKDDKSANEWVDAISDGVSEARHLALSEASTRVSHVLGLEDLKLDSGNKPPQEGERSSGSKKDSAKDHSKRGDKDARHNKFWKEPKELERMLNLWKASVDDADHARVGSDAVWADESDDEERVGDDAVWEDAPGAEGEGEDQKDE